MKTCAKCGKKGPFLWLSKSGYCEKCAAEILDGQEKDGIPAQARPIIQVPDPLPVSPPYVSEEKLSRNVLVMLKQRYVASGSPEALDKIERDYTDDEIMLMILYDQLRAQEESVNLLRNIKGCIVFFLILAVIGILVGITAFI